MTNRSQTKFALFTASKIPKPPGTAATALVSFPSNLQKKLDKRDSDFVSYFRAHISESSVPQEQDFIQMTVQSKNVKEKFRELKDVHHDMYCDLIVQVVKKPFEDGFATTLWVSDYTTNSQFYNFSGTESDTLKDENATGKCPRGQLSMQISCFDEHIMHIQEAGITRGTWISIRNVRILHGRMGSNLEGFMRGFQGDSRDVGKPIKITALNVDDKDDLTPHHKAALERLRDYLRAEKTKHQLLEDAAAAGRKRKANGATVQSTENSKTRRRAGRASKRLKLAEQEASKQDSVESGTPEGQIDHQQGMASTNGSMGAGATADVQDHLKRMARTSMPSNLNASGMLNGGIFGGLANDDDIVKCENHGEPPKSVAIITQEFTFTHELGNGQDTYPLPFVNRKYRADVRVCDFFPANLKDFARRKRVKQQVVGLDLLSNDGESDVASSSDDADDGEESAVWEWCFWLQLEDASPDIEPKQRFWVFVDNLSGQCLTNLDADSLEENESLLRKLRENLFILWGDLEDQKPARDAAGARSVNKGKKKRRGETPPPHSDGEGDDDGLKVKVSNKPFSCCVAQYGVKVTENDPGKANAGERHRWQRIFKLFGTRIV